MLTEARTTTEVSYYYGTISKKESKTVSKLKQMDLRMTLIKDEDCPFLHVLELSSSLLVRSMLEGFAHAQHFILKA